MKVKIYATLREMLGVKSIDMMLSEPTPVRRVLQSVVDGYPALRSKLWNSDGTLTGYVTVLLGGKSIEYLDGLESMVEDSDTMSLFPPVGGG